MSSSTTYNQWRFRFRRRGSRPSQRKTFMPTHRGATFKKIRNRYQNANALISPTTYYTSERGKIFEVTINRRPRKKTDHVVVMAWWRT